MNKNTEYCTIPLINFSPFNDPDSSVEHQISVAKDVIEAFKSHGFVYLKNIDAVPPEMVSEAFQWSKKFFDLPLEIKKQALHPKDGLHHRGFSPIGFEQVKPIKNSTQVKQDQVRLTLDHKETFDIGSSKNKLIHNIWLNKDTEKIYKLDGFQNFFEIFYKSCQKLEIQILKAISIGLMGIENLDYLGNFHKESNNQIRLAYYPAIQDNQLMNGIRERFGSHTDFGSITILFQDQVGGLQVENLQEPGEFMNVKPIDGTVVVNIGDLLMRWSNDTLHSTLHRVGRPDGIGLLPARYSIPYFCGPDPKTLIKALPGYELNPKYEPIYTDDYLKMRMQASY